MWTWNSWVIIPTLPWWSVLSFLFIMHYQTYVVHGTYVELAPEHKCPGLEHTLRWSETPELESGALGCLATKARSTSLKIQTKPFKQTLANSLHWICPSEENQVCKKKGWTNISWCLMLRQGIKCVDLKTLKLQTTRKVQQSDTPWWRTLLVLPYYLSSTCSYTPMTWI